MKNFIKPCRTRYDFELAFWIKAILRSNAIGSRGLRILEGKTSPGGVCSPPGEVSQAEKDEPQPQVVTALGLRITN